jgi:hypothetical protein
MSFIEPARTGMFSRPSDIVFGRIVEELESFNASGIIDRGIFYTYVKEVLHNLGAAVYKEDQAILDIKNSNHPLPANFCTFWAAFSIKAPDNYIKDKGYDPRTDITLWHSLEAYTTDLVSAPNKCWNYCIECPSQMDLTSRIAVRYYISGEDARCYEFSQPSLMSFGTIPPMMLVDGHSPCYRSGSPQKVSIDNDKFLWTTFSNGCVYLQYWGMPVDKETGLPYIPDNPNIEKAIEYYIEYRLLRKWYLNNRIGDLERKVAMLKADSDEALGVAMTETKTPSFRTLMDVARRNKDRLSIFQLNDHNYYHRYAG